METKLHVLPPLKRFRLMQQQEENTKHHCLPAKKRKDLRNLSILPPPLPAEKLKDFEKLSSWPSLLPAKKRKDVLNPSLFSFPLPAKKRKYLQDLSLLLSPLPAKKRRDSRNPSPFPAKGLQNLSPLFSVPPIKKMKDLKKGSPLLPKDLRSSPDLQNVPPFPAKDLQNSSPLSSIRPVKKCEDLQNSSPSPPNFPTTSFSLPAKKRVCAIPPFDLSIEYQPPVEFEKHIEQESLIAVPRAHSDSNNNDYDDDGIVCAICESTDGDPTDPIVLCDGCDLMVHTTCYGHPLVEGVPQGDWFCAQCLDSQEKEISCCLCPDIGGALKPTNDGKWAHIVCALFVPEVFFSDPDGRQGIDCSKVPRKRWENSCYVCKKIGNGCVIDCSEPNCGLSFHVSCGLKQDLCIEYQQGKKTGGAAVVAGFCRKHTDLWEKQQKTGKFKIVAREPLLV